MICGNDLREYLCELLQQQMCNYRWYSDVKKMVLNNMVLIKDDDITPQNKWKKGVLRDRPNRRYAAANADLMRRMTNE